MAGDFYKLVFVYSDVMYNSPKYISDSASHEVGHTLGLHHDGTDTSGYYLGHGSGAVGWAPIMGMAYYKNLAQWSKGEYLAANNPEDDLQLISQHVPYRPDDHGNNCSTATVVSYSALLQVEWPVLDRQGADSNRSLDFAFASFRTRRSRGGGIIMRPEFQAE